MKNTYFLVTAWDDTKWKRLSGQLYERYGIPKEQVIRISQRVSRPISLNKALETIPNDCFVVFLDEDIWLPQDHVFHRMRDVLDVDSSIVGVIAEPKLVHPGETWREKATSLPENNPIATSLFDCTSNLVSLNCAMFKRSEFGFFNEDLFGNQNFDVDFGWDFAQKGKKVVIDKALLVCTEANDYFSKSLSYHTVVARNLHVLRAKWTNINAWQGVAVYNARMEKEGRLSDIVPSIEEITHWSELTAIKYCYKYNQDGLMRCYLNPRFGGIVNVAVLHQSIEMAIKDVPFLGHYTIDKPGALPVFK